MFQVYEYSPTAIFTFGVGVVLFVATLLLLFLPKNKDNKDQIAGLSTYGLFIFVVAFLSILCLVSSMFYKDTISSPTYKVTNVSTGNYLTVNGTTISSEPFGSDNLALGLTVLLSIVDGTIGGLALFLYGFRIFKARQKKKYDFQNPK